MNLPPDVAVAVGTLLLPDGRCACRGDAKCLYHDYTPVLRMAADIGAQRRGYRDTAHEQQVARERLGLVSTR